MVENILLCILTSKHIECYSVKFIVGTGESFKIEKKNDNIAQINKTVPGLYTSELF